MKNQKQIITRNPNIVSGAIVFTGTRVPVQILIDYLKAGETLDRFLDGFPTVKRKQAEAFLEEAKTVEIRKEQGGILLPLLPTAKEEPIRRLGKRPVTCGVPNGSEAHNEYLYGSG